MNPARLDDRALLDTLEPDDPTSASERLARILDPDGRSLARRDAALLSLHRERFGDALHCAGECPSCGEVLELEVPVAALIPPSLRESELRVICDGFEVEYRMPESGDLLAARDERSLAERCVTAAHRIDDETPLDAASLPAPVLTAMDDAMAVQHPAGGLSVEVTCVVCGDRWDAGLEVASFIAARARVDALHVVSEIHALAAAYGWTEAEVLAVPRARRRHYLDLVLR
jgi:hypothetical protein